MCVHIYTYMCTCIGVCIYGRCVCTHTHIYMEGVCVCVCIYIWRVQDQSITSHNVNDRNLDEDSSGCSSNYSYNIF